MRSNSKSTVVRAVFLALLTVFATCPEAHALSLKKIFKATIAASLLGPLVQPAVETGILLGTGATVTAGTAATTVLATAGTTVGVATTTAVTAIGLSTNTALSIAGATGATVSLVGTTVSSTAAATASLAGTTVATLGTVAVPQSVQIAGGWLQLNYGDSVFTPDWVWSESGSNVKVFTAAGIPSANFVETVGAAYPRGGDCWYTDQCMGRTKGFGDWEFNPIPYPTLEKITKSAGDSWSVGTLSASCWTVHQLTGDYTISAQMAALVDVLATADIDYEYAVSPSGRTYYPPLPSIRPRTDAELASLGSNGDPHSVSFALNEVGVWKVYQQYRSYGSYVRWGGRIQDFVLGQSYEITVKDPEGCLAVTLTGSSGTYSLSQDGGVGYSNGTGE